MAERPCGRPLSIAWIRAQSQIGICDGKSLARIGLQDNMTLALGVPDGSYIFSLVLPVCITSET
ncbi:hypothetical protein N7451_007490 [Penicillium sp. IBT 35674x]|nr:hypothetical protein N7451_007490 [Penicillium sp. IBT 35674x]